jgi:hypothetical protein
VCYMAEASVEMAIQILHGGCIRPMTPALSVTRASFQPKESDPAATTTATAEGGGGGGKRPRAPLTHAQVKVAQNAMAQALAWNEDDDIGVKEYSSVA